MTDDAAPPVSFSFDAATRALVRLSARIAGGSELDVRAGLRDTQAAETPAEWVEELILQSHLFCGFPRALNAAREWRRAVGAGLSGEEDGDEVQGRSAETREEEYGALMAEGEVTCAKVYGRFYDKLRQNVVALHPALDRWMVVEGYGKVLSRPGLDLGRRELCIVAACAASGQDRQLHSHLHGARNVGVPDSVIGAAVEALEGIVPAATLLRAGVMWGKVRGQ